MSWDAMLADEERRAQQGSSDRIAASNALYGLAERIRNEATAWTNVAIRQDLNSLALTVEDRARAALHLDPIATDHATLTLERALKAIVGARKLIEHLVPATRGYITLDCRGGVHAGCDTCDCRCHA